MKSFSKLMVAAAVAAALAGTASADAPTIPKHVVPDAPQPESLVAPARATTNLEFAAVSDADTSVISDATGTKLTPPVSLTYSGSSSALTITDSGSDRGITVMMTNSKDPVSAIYGQTNGVGAGLTGENTGKSGAGGKFTVTNAESTQPALYATTTGLGAAVFGTVTNGGSESPAIYGQNLQGSNGIGVEGDGIAVGVYGYNEYNTGVSGYSGGSADGVLGQSQNGNGVQGNSYGTGAGIYGYSSNGSAGYFNGSVVITNSLTVSGVNISSDRNLKEDFQPIDGRDLLARIDKLPITSWDYKADKAKRHVGPMAQDFHAAFGLDGNDDTHISVVDAAGVSLAAIQELSREMKAKDAEILALRKELAAQADAIKTVTTLAETLSARSSTTKTKLHVPSNAL